MARYIIEYMIYLFSNYLLTHKDPDMDKNINDFLKDKIKIDENFVYGTVPKAFSEKSGLMSRGKLVVQNLETLKRLVYVLRLSLIRSRKKVLDYHNKQVMDNYFEDITDYRHYPEQVILQGEKAFEQWLYERQRDYTLYKTEQQNKIQPYFFKNRRVQEKQVFLAQNTSNLEIAKFIGENWIRLGYNKGIEEEIKVENITFKLYLYKNSKNITPVKIQGKENNYDIKI